MNYILVKCKNFDECGEMIERVRVPKDGAVCYPCKVKRQNKRYKEHHGG